MMTQTLGTLHLQERPGRTSVLLALNWLGSGHYNHLGSELVTKRTFTFLSSLCKSDLPIFFFSKRAISSKIYHDSEALLQTDSVSFRKECKEQRKHNVRAQKDGGFKLARERHLGRNQVYYHLALKFYSLEP